MDNTLIAQKVTEHAQMLGVDEQKIRTYQVSLNWMLEHGTLVDVHAYGMGLFNAPATLAELGIQSGDVRARRLRPGRRELIVSHPTAHFYHIEPEFVYLGFDASLPPPPTAYFRKASRVTAIHWLGADDWQPIEEISTDSRWLPLDIPEESWPARREFGETARWLRLSVGAGTVKPSFDDIVCNPASALRSIETRCRKSIDMPAGGFGQKFAGFGGFAWIGFKAWPTWLAEWTRLEAELDRVKCYILWRYDEFIGELRDQFEELAIESWLAMAARRKGKKFAYAPGNGDGPIETQVDFEQYIVAEALERLPTREAIERKVQIGYVVSLALGQADVMADKLEAERIHTDLVKEHTAQALIEEEARSQQRLLWERERAEHDRLETERLAMKQAALEKAREQMTEMVSPYQQMLENLRAEMYRAATEIAASMRKSGALRGKVAERARNLVDYCHIMNSHNDTELEALLGQLGDRLPARGGAKKDSAKARAVEKALDEIIELTEQAAVSIRDREADSYGVSAIEL